ncbi:hypothetical protein F5Y19DRAFT_472062 [Xylariaceae sp. FL1651]|nr:hypothetical protein F5Y19DRAFT_472062 [Xylariaceae sp. FL1651]
MTANYIVDLDGDLTLNLGPGVHAWSVQVCSRALSRWSPVWKDIISNFDDNDDGKKPSVLSAPDDEPYAMIILLYIIHGEFVGVPELPSVQVLYEITGLTKKYKITGLLRPWAKYWVSVLLHQVEEHVPTIQKALAITYELGENDMFNLLVKRIANLTDDSLLRWTESRQPTDIHSWSMFAGIARPYAKIRPSAPSVEPSMLDCCLSRNPRPYFAPRTSCSMSSQVYSSRFRRAQIVVLPLQSWNRVSSNNA